MSLYSQATKIKAIRIKELENKLLDMRELNEKQQEEIEALKFKIKVLKDWRKKNNEDE